MSPPLRNYDQAAKWLGVPTRWLQTQVRAKRVRYTPLGRYVRFSQADLDLIVETHKAGPEPAPVVEPMDPRLRPARARRATSRAEPRSPRLPG